jgi:hypothetical protein
MKKNYDREEILGDIEVVHHIDHVGKDGRNCKYLMYLDTSYHIQDDQYKTYFGADVLDSTYDINSVIHQMIMRSRNISMAEATAIALKEQPYLIVEDLDFMLAWEYKYIVIH